MNSTPTRSQNLHTARPNKILITDTCRDDLARYSAHQDKYDKVIERLQQGDEGCARHAVRGSGCSRFKVFESTITGDLRLCWSYASHFAEPSIVLWTLDGHDRVFRKLRRMTGERFKELKFKKLDVRKEQDRLMIGSGDFEWSGVRPPALLELNKDESLGAWISEHLALSEEQSMEIVREVDEGPMLLSGGGGSGKTTLLINLLLRQLEAGERPLLVTYHMKLAEYCKRLIGDHPLRNEAIRCIKTIDELLKESLEQIGLSERLNYISQAESKALFVRGLPDELKEPAWAEFRGMWKGRVDVKAYARRQRELDALKTRQGRGSDLTLTAEGSYIHIDELKEVSKKQAQQIEKERYWRERPKYKIPNISDKDALERKEFYRQERAYRQRLEEEKREIRALTHQLEVAKRDYHLTSKRYGRDVRFIQDESMIKEAITTYESQLAQRGGDRLNACLEMLCQADRIRSDYTSLLIDEVQDFTRLELEFLSLFMPNPKRWVIAGDENQIVNPSGFKWERVKEVIYLSAHRILDHCESSDPLYIVSQSLLKELTEIQPVYLTVNYRNPAPIKRFAQRVLGMKSAGGWGVTRDQGTNRATNPAILLEPPPTEEELSMGDDRHLSPEEAPWAWRPQSLEVDDLQQLYQHIIWLSKSVPSFCLIVFSQKEKVMLIEQLKALMQKGDPEIDFERVLTPLEVKGLEFDLVIALRPPCPESEIEGIRDFEFNQLYVSATRARTSLAYLWTGEQEERSFRIPVNQEDQGDEVTIYRSTWEHFIKLSHLHFAHDSADWAKSAARYALQGEHKMAAELYRVGGFYLESAELLEHIGELEGAIRDYQHAQMPMEQARCEAKLAEQKGQRERAFEAWERCASLSGDYEGFWRTLEGSTHQKGGLSSVARLISQAYTSRSLILEEYGSQATLQRSLSREGVDPHRLFKDQQESLSIILGEEPSREVKDEGSARRQLRALRQSPSARAVNELTKNDEVLKLINPDSAMYQDVPPSPLTIAELELLLGAGSYYERRRDVDKGRELLSLTHTQEPWIQLPKPPLKLYQKKGIEEGLPEYLSRHGSLTTSNRVMWETKRKVEEHPALKSARKVIRASHQDALARWGERAIQYTDKPQMRGVLRPDPVVSPHGLYAKALTIADWQNEIKRAYQSSGLGTLLSEELPNVPIYSSWDQLEERARNGVERLIEIMGQLRLSHSPTRLYTAHRFAELWTSLMLDCVGHWLHRPAIESLTYLEDEVIERLSSCSMSELRSYLIHWEEKAWQSLKASPLPEDPKDMTLAVQGRMVQHLMGIWSMGQALFMRGTWAGFINEKLKVAEQLTSYGYAHLRAANSHWVGLTFLPLHGLMAACMHYEERRARLSAERSLQGPSRALKTAQSKLKSSKSRLKSLNGQRRDLRAELKRLASQSVDPQLGNQRVDRETLEDQLRQISAERDELHARVPSIEAQVTSLDTQLKMLTTQLIQDQERLQLLRDQRDFFEWTLCQADSISRRSRRLSDEDYEEVRASWRTGREWGKLIFDIGEQELLVFLSLLNRYRTRQGLKTFSPEELHFNEGLRRSGALRRGGQSVWREVMGSLNYSSPLATFQSEGRAGELPSAGATLSFAIEQGYTPLILELFEDRYYLDRAREALYQMASWRHNHSHHELFKRELSVLCATPLRAKSQWLKPALDASQDRLRPLLTMSNEDWVKEMLRHMRAVSDELPLPLMKGARQLLALWGCLSTDEQSHARPALFELARLWPSHFADAVEGLLLGQVDRLSDAYNAGERWLLLSPLCARAVLTRPHGESSVMRDALLWLQER